MKKLQKAAIAAVIIGLLVCVKSCIDRKQPDLTIAYIGDGFVDRNMFEKNAGVVRDLCEDIDRNGEVNIDIMEISFNENLAQADLNNATAKLTNAVGQGAARLYFIDEKYMKQNASTGFFADLSKLGDGFVNAEGKVVALSLAGNEKTAELGIENGDNMYLAIRVVSEWDKKTDKNVDAKDRSAWKIAEYLIDN